MNDDPTPAPRVPTLEQSSTLAELVRRSELTDEHRHALAELLDEIGTSVRVADRAARDHPGDSALQDLVARAVWTPVGAQYTRLLDAVRPAPPGATAGPAR